MDYRKSLEQAVIYIEANLREDIRVEEVAKAAGYSLLSFKPAVPFPSG